MMYLKDLGFENISIEEEYSDTVEEGYIISQNPEYVGEFRINVDDEIKLVVSKGQKIVTLPNKMVGKNVTDDEDNAQGVPDGDVIEWNVIDYNFIQKINDKFLR